MHEGRWQRQAPPVTKAALRPPDRSLPKYKCFQPFPLFAPSAQINTTIVSFQPSDAAHGAVCGPIKTAVGTGGLTPLALSQPFKPFVEVSVSAKI